MKIDLNGGDALARSSLASAQRRLNLYAEMSDPKIGESHPTTWYPTPGLKKLGTTPNHKNIRGLYRASNGDLYCVAGFDVYYIDPSFTFNLVGTMHTTSVLNPTKMSDNGTSVILCDGTPSNGYSINMKTRIGLSNLFDPTASDELTSSSTGWLGSTYVDFSDGFFIANFIGTPTFYISNAQDVIFDPLQFSAKTSNPDFVVGVAVQHRVVWVIGQLSTEVWYNSGGGTGPDNFPFTIMPGVAIDWGCAATYSIAKAETSLFWLAQNYNGERIVLKGNGYTVGRISTHPIEDLLRKMDDVSDCIAYCYMQDGHAFYVMNFPSADQTLVYDLATNMWHERCYLDANGEEHMQRGTCHAFAYGKNIVNDWQNENLYELDLDSYTDDGQLVKRVVGFPRIIDAEDDSRVLYKNFIAEIETGSTRNVSEDPTICLKWSEDKGVTYSNGIIQSIGKAGDFAKFVKFNRLGMSRNRNFLLEWTANARVVIQAAYVNVGKALS